LGVRNCTGNISCYSH